MKRNLLLWLFGGFTFATALGTLLHFLYGWTGLDILAPISTINESTWEHMKILFFPMLIFACIQSKYFSQEYPGFWWIQAIGILLSVGSVPILFYTYNGAFGTSPDWLNILFFFLSAGLGYWMESILLRKNFSLPYPAVAIAVILVGVTLFVAFTFAPPSLPLFQDLRI